MATHTGNRNHSFNFELLHKRMTYMYHTSLKRFYELLLNNIEHFHSIFITEVNLFVSSTPAITYRLFNGKVIIRINFQGFERYVNFVPES